MEYYSDSEKLFEAYDEVRKGRGLISESNKNLNEDVHHVKYVKSLANNKTQITDVDETEDGRFVLHLSDGGAIDIDPKGFKIKGSPSLIGRHIVGERPVKGEPGYIRLFISKNPDATASNQFLQFDMGDVESQEGGYDYESPEGSDQEGFDQEDGGEESSGDVQGFESGEEEPSEGNEDEWRAEDDSSYYGSQKMQQRASNAGYGSSAEYRHRSTIGDSVEKKRKKSSY